MSRRFVLILCLSLPLLAGEDVDFARALASKGYFDLAKEVCESIKTKPGVAQEDKSAVPFISADIKLTEAERDPDPKHAEELINEAVKELETWLAGNPSHPLRNDALVTMGQLKVRLAQILNAAMQNEASPEKKSEYQSRITKLYKDVENEYRRRISDLLKKMEGEDPSEDDANAYMDARLELPRTLLDHARYGGADDEEKKKLLKEAVDGLTEFNFDYGDRPMAYEGYRIEGECWFELGDNQKAEDRLTAATGLYGRIVEAGLQPSDYHWNIIRGAYISLAKTYMKMARNQDAVDRIKAYLAIHKDIKGQDPYYFMKLLMGDALFQGADRKAAIDAAKQVMAEAGEDTSWGQRAKDRIAGWLAAPAPTGVKVSAKDRMTSLDSYMERGKFFEALSAGRACIEAIGTEEERKNLLAAVWFKTGQCLQELKRNYEAASAYERVVELESGDPKSSYGPKACFKALSCYAQEFDAWGNASDEKKKDELMNRLLGTWKDAKEGLNLGIIKADKLRNAGDLEGAAQAYLAVDPKAEAYEFALVQAGNCYFLDAARKWSKSQRSSADKSACAAEMDKGEKALKTFLDRLKDSTIEAPESEEDKKLRDNLKAGAQQQLAQLYSHEAVGKAKECLELIDEASKDYPAGDSKLASLWQLKVGAYLAQDKLDEAVTVLEEMFTSYPDGKSIALAAKSVAIRLDEKTMQMMKENGDEKEVTSNLKKVAKYYMKWLSEGMSIGLRISMQDVIGVAQMLYMVAKRANGLDEKVVSFLDLGERRIKERGYWNDAAFVHEMLVSERAGKLNEKDKLDLAVRLARCYSFLAEGPSDWEKAKKQYTDIVNAYKLVDARQAIDRQVLTAKPALLGVYLELGAVLLELARAGQKFQFDNAITIYNNVLGVTLAGSEPWWMAKYQALYALYLRGGAQDVDTCKIAVENLERNYPDYDEDKYGMKTKFKELKRRLPH